VIELTGIDESRLSNENGDREVIPLIESYLRWADNPSVDDPAAFRIEEVTPNDVTQFTIQAAGCQMTCRTVSGGRIPIV
jgi:hypothetical protein